MFTPRIASVALYRWWQRACEPPIWQAPAPCDRMRQHCCHIAAAWSAAGVLADGNGRRAGRSRASRAAAGAIRRLPRCAAPRAPIGTQHAWLPLTAVARHCAGRPASGGDDRALRQRPRGASNFATTARSGGSTALTWRHTWTRALRMCSVTRPSVGRGVNFGCTVKGHGRDAWCEHLDTTHRKIFSRHGDGVL